MEKTSMRSGDMLTGILLGVGSILVMFSSYRMTLPVLAQGHPLESSPGIVPGILAVFMLILSVNLVSRGKCEGGSLRFLMPSRLWNAVNSTEGRNTIIILGLIDIYIFGLLRFLPYCVATFLFLYVFILLYYKRRYIYVTFIALATSLVITYAFGQLAGIPLPGRMIQIFVPGINASIVIP